METEKAAPSQVTLDDHRDQDAWSYCSGSQLGKILTFRDIWLCLETLSQLRDGTGIQQVATRDAGNQTMHTTSPHNKEVQGLKCQWCHY